MNNRQIIAAIKILVRRNNGEIHGDFNQLADKISVELADGYDDEILELFKNHLLMLGLERLTASSPIAFFRSMNGEINFVDRETILEK